jgi:DNA polymerase-3 subunit epsilon
LRRDSFVALDFETADPGADSACAIGLVKITEGQVAQRVVHLIRPPRPYFHFTHIHGITWDDCKDKPTFAQLWPSIRPLFDGAEFIAAHNASFDKRVLTACCQKANIPLPSLPFLCTVKLSRSLWNIRPTKLSDVCRELAIKLNHHEALSDANACAEIVRTALQDGADLAAHV